MVRNIFSYLLKRSKPNSLFIKQSRNYAATPKTFKAAYYQNKFDFKIKEKELEKLNKSQVRIQVDYCGLNKRDILLCSQYDKNEDKDDQKKCLIPGYEVSGVIVELGEKSKSSGLHIGDNVGALNIDNYGGLATHISADVKDVWKLPTSVEKEQAVCLLNHYTISLIGISRLAKVKENTYILISCSTGGQGLSALEISSAVYRAKVIAVCDSEDHADFLREKGAWSALVYNKEKSVLDKIKSLTKDTGVRVLFETTGKTFYDILNKCLALEGVALLVDQHYGSDEKLLTVPTSFSLAGLSLSEYRRRSPQLYRQAVQDCLDLCDQGLINPSPDKIFGLSQVGKAFEYWQNERPLGKVVVALAE